MKTRGLVQPMPHHNDTNCLFLSLVKMDTPHFCSVVRVQPIIKDIDINACISSIILDDDGWENCPS